MQAQLKSAKSGSKIYGVSAIDNLDNGKKVTIIVKNEKKTSVEHRELTRANPNHGGKNFWQLYKERLAGGNTLLMKFRHMFEFDASQIEIAREWEQIRPRDIPRMRNSMLLLRSDECKHVSPGHIIGKFLEGIFFNLHYTRPERNIIAP